MVFARVQNALAGGTTLPGTRYFVKGAGNRRGEPAIIYCIPNRKSEAPHEKGVSKSELEKAHSQLLASGHFTRAWFNENLPAAALEGPCNFIAIGAAFVAVGIARRGRAEYVLKTAVS
jgi:hypothetical protein